MVCLPRERDCGQFNNEELLEIGRKVITMEAEELSRLSCSVGMEIVEAARIIQNCEGRLVVVGMGKSGIIGRKIAATLASLGTPSFFLHAAEAAHGDLGMVCREDVGLFISHSGNSEEILKVLPFFRRIGAPVIAITGNKESPLARNCDVFLSAPIDREADPLNLAPTSSTTVQLALGDALAVVLTRMRNIEDEDFALFHPSGSLGRKLLLKVEDVMGSGSLLPVVPGGSTVGEALFEITSKGYGATTVVDDKGMLMGIFTDGDLRRLIESKGYSCMAMAIEEVMTREPSVISPSKLAAEAVRIMEEKEISVLVAVEDGKPSGMVHLHELLKAGVA
jgi:arabinose-5-phosphate isomerase